jgi:Family of unknown function (DUF6069)
VTTTRTARTTSPSTRPTRARALGVLGAALAALAIWVVADQLLGANLLVRSGGGSTQSVGAGTVVAASLLAALLGWALLAVLERRTSRARAVWTGVALVVLLLSLSGPLTGGTTPSTRATLVLMHLTVAAVLIPTLRRSSPAA